MRLFKRKGKEGIRMKKQFNTMMNVGHIKYLVNFHDGIQQHKDESAFFDIRIFKNKKKRDQFIKELLKQDYKER